MTLHQFLLNQGWQQLNDNAERYYKPSYGKTASAGEGMYFEYKTWPPSRFSITELVPDIAQAPDEPMSKPPLNQSKLF